MRWIAFVLLVTGFFSFTAPLSSEYPTDFFQAPVTSVLRLSGTFGELRPNHFHGGIDIKGGIGVPILAAGEGYISRIRVSGGGYGNHLFVTHPNGYTSVYAHLLDFAPEIQAYVRQMQYAEEHFDMDLMPDPGHFPVRRGQVIGRMGNTGHSFGPHLHFEIRETQSDKALNPLLFGLTVADQMAPRLHQVKIYELSDGLEEISSRILPLTWKNGAYHLANDTIVVRSPRVGISVKVYDHMDGVSNQNGVYGLDLFFRDSLSYGFRMDRIGGEESRALNAHLDYAEQSLRNSYFHRCFLLPGNPLGIYEEKKNGILHLQPGEQESLRVAIRDIAGNQSALQIVVQRTADTPTPIIPRAPYQYFLSHEKPFMLEDASFYLHIPAGTFYENLYMQHEKKAPSSAGMYSVVHRLHTSSVPVHHAFMLGIRAEHIPVRLREKAFIAHLSGSYASNYGGQWQEDGMLVAPVRALGYFCVMVDTIPPVIQAERMASDMRKYDSFSFRIRDNVSGSMNVSNLKFRATIDNRWVLMEYDEKNRRLTHYFESSLGNGSHEYELQVSDAMGNTTSYKRTFLR